MSKSIRASPDGKDSRRKGERMRRRQVKTFVLLVLLVAFGLAVLGCNKGGEGRDGEEPTPSPMETSETEEAETGKPKVTPMAKGVNREGEDEEEEGVVMVDVDNTTTYQTIEGFGGAFSWYADLILQKEHKSEVYDLLFRDAKMTILRFKNDYKYGEGPFEAELEKEIYQEAKKRMKEYGQKPTVLMSSWSPSGDLKSNDVVNGGGTLRRNKKGKYVYDKFGQYWYEAIKAYQTYGIPIDFLSIQNECDFEAGYDGCEFGIMESESLASYAKAYLATYDAIQKLKNPPRMMGPETMTIEAMTLRLYMEEVFKEAPESVYGIAHHLYNGGTHTDPHSFVQNMKEVNEYYPNLSKWQTEFFRGNLMQTAQLIQNSMLYENLNAYLFWGSVWHGAPDSQSLIKLDAMDDPELYTFERGYRPTEHYYAMRHFSEHVLPGYKRVGTTVSRDNTFDKISCSAYANEDQSNLVMVAINATKEDEEFQFNLKDYDITDSKMIMTQFKGPYVGINDDIAPEVEPDYPQEWANYEEYLKTVYQEAGPLPENHVVSMPANSMVTIVCNGGTDAEVTSGVASNASDGGENEDAMTMEVAKGTNVAATGDDAELNAVTAVTLDQVAYGDHGASASFQTLWKDDKLYVRVDARDATSDVSGADYSNKDSVEFFLNESNSKGATYGFGDIHLAVNRNGEVEEAVGVPVDAVEVHVADGGEGYVVTVGIPFQSVQPTVGTRMGFDVQVNDASNGARTYALKWCDSSRFTFENLSKIGTIELK